MMGNQLTGIAPSQILPVEQYLIEVPDYKYDCSLGSTRFFKVARALCKEGLSVVKVFVIHDPSLPLSNHRDRLEELNSRLHGTSNCLPYQKALQSEKAALLFRQYVKDSLYDRISTRPFLNLLEKKWIAFQILCGLNQCHKLKVFHGDIKSENVMVTSWNWVLLTDFASFKPTYLPEDNPSDFSYFFDTSRRRICYIAPERFVESGWKNFESSAPTINLDLASNNIKEGELTSAMDIFSAGCVITELFTEGTTPFDLSQLLAYRNGEYSPWKILENIQDTSVRELVRHMMQKDPSHRLSAEEYLIQQRGKAFPEYFYTFLKLYIQRFATQPLLPPDDRINRMKKDIDFIFKSLNVDEKKLESNKGLVILISVVTSCLRDLHYYSSRLVALDLLLELSKYVTPDIVLDRILPYILFFAADRFPRVRMETIKTIASCLSRIKSVPKSDVNVFPEYIFPVLSVLTQDEVASVRATYAANIAQLAETALRFLEMTQLSEEDGDSTEKDTPGTTQYQSSYDIELQALQETIQQKVVTLLSDPENSVKQTLLDNGITRLCVFFGRQKANDVLLSHMITFLNDKQDWQLRGSFFDNIVGVAAYVGWQSSSILRPLLQQGVSDSEEFVVHKTIGALTCLAELGLIQKSMLQEFVKEVAPFLVHPNVWIRHVAVGFLCAVAKAFSIADVHCNLVPQVQMFLKQKVLQLNQPVIVLNALEDPIPRKVYDYILRSNHIDGIISVINERNYMRSISRYGHKPVYSDLDEVMSQVFRKLVSLGMSEKHEDCILAMKDVFVKLHRSRSSSADSFSDTDDIHKLGTLSVSQLTRLATRRHADLNKSKENKGENQSSPSNRRKKKSPQPETPTTNMNAEWKSMFGTVESTKPQNTSIQKSKSMNKSDQPDKRGSMTSSLTSASISSQTSSTGSIVNVTQSQVAADGFQRSISPSQEMYATQTRYSACKLELRNLVHHRREQYSNDIVTKDLLEGIVWDSRPPPTNWRPKGLLVAHLHEHRDAINKIDVSHDHSFFLTCSDDGSVKVWKSDLLEGKSAINRSRHTLTKQGGRIKCLTFCDGSDTFAAASDNGTINAYRIESGKVTGLSSHVVDTEEFGQVVDMLHFDSGSQQVLTYATVNGYLIGQDYRSPTLAWKLKNQPKIGLITSFAIHNSLCWLAVGTSNGSHVCWDMRFQLPITTITHPTGARVRKLLMHSREQSWIVSALQGNNEISMWDVETGARQKVLWASSAPALSQTQASNHSIYGMNMVTTDNNMYLLTGGSDQRVRFWDLGNPNNSFVLAGAACDPHNQMVVNYSSRLIDGTEVVQEVYTKKQSSNEDIPRRGPEAPAQGHHDIVNDVNICQGSQCLVITASRDGVLQVWK